MERLQSSGKQNELICAKGRVAENARASLLAVAKVQLDYTPHPILKDDHLVQSRFAHLCSSGLLLKIEEYLEKAGDWNFERTPAVGIQSLFKVELLHSVVKIQAFVTKMSQPFVLAPNIVEVPSYDSYIENGFVSSVLTIGNFPHGESYEIPALPISFPGHDLVNRIWSKKAAYFMWDFWGMPFVIGGKFAFLILKATLVDEDEYPNRRVNQHTLSDELRARFGEKEIRYQEAKTHLEVVFRRVLGKDMVYRALDEASLKRIKQKGSVKVWQIQGLGLMICDDDFE